MIRSEHLDWQAPSAGNVWNIKQLVIPGTHSPCGDGWVAGKPTEASAPRKVRRHSPYRRSRARSARLPSLLYLGMPRERTHGAAWHPRRAATRPDSAGRANRSVVIQRASVDIRRLCLQLEVTSGHGLENVPPFHRCLLGGPFGRSCRAPFRLAAAREPARSPPVSPRRVAPLPPMDRRSVLGGRPDVTGPRPGRGGVREHLPWREGTLGCVSPGWTGSRAPKITATNVRSGWQAGSGDRPFSPKPGHTRPAG